MNIQEALISALFKYQSIHDYTVTDAVRYLAPKIEKALRVAIQMAYKAGQAFSEGSLTNSSEDCVEAFIKELKK